MISCENHRTVRILMIAPEPFFEPRGTPFSEFHRIRALTALGHHVDLVTYPFGQAVAMPGLRVFRSLRPPFVHHVGIGPSLAKIPLDSLLAQIVLIENAPGSAEDDATPAAAAAVRRSLNLSDATPIVLYTGTFEAYQGLDLLFAAMAIVRRSRPDARLVLAGGRADQVTKAR